MPLTQIRLLDSTTALGQWELTEPEAALLEQAPGWLQPPGIPAHLTHDRRRREWLAGRILVEALLVQLTGSGTAATGGVVTDAFGRPRLTDDRGAVSLSHGAENVVALVALGPARRAGLDLEPVRTKALTLAPRFLSAEELPAIGGELSRASLAWGLKEALYKAYGRRQLDFRQHLRLNLHDWPPPPAALAPTGTVAGRITQPETGRAWHHTLHYEACRQGWLAYCVT